YLQQLSFPWYSLFPPFGGSPIGREPPETHRCVNFHFLSVPESNNSWTTCLIVIFGLRMLLVRPPKITRILGHGRVAAWAVHKQIRVYNGDPSSVGAASDANRC